MHYMLLILQNGETPLCVAVECGTINAVKALIQYGASVNQHTQVSVWYAHACMQLSSG